MKNLIYIIINIIIWILSAVFLFIHSNGVINVSPWIIQNFVTITIQIATIFLPIIGLILSIFIKKRLTKFIIILVCVINIYYTSIPFIFAWLHYFKII